ncbi:hypothetical protein DY000_02007746 [Brassica cretica]|uniref:Uncharacterized protein n=1 Tax=Brassica cretica TaxID=69181 RepID=A0ABQ7BTP5_BRACR|nr:hypothetical protein DY000_02007746 [Brassica cretica]
MKGKSLKLLLMGRVPREYPSYINILGAQPAMMAPSETDGETQYKLSDLAKVPTDDAANSMGEGLIDRDVDTRPVNMKKKKNNKSSKKTKVNPYAEKTVKETTIALTFGWRKIVGIFRWIFLKTPPKGSRRKLRGQNGSGRLMRRLKRDKKDLSIVLPAFRRAFWKGSNPPTKKPPVTTTECVEFCYDKDVTLVNDFDAFGNQIPQIKRGVRLIPKATARSNLLILENQLALQKAKAKLAEEKLTIKAKDAEFENIKKEVLEKAKEVVAKRNHHYRECKQAKQRATDLEEIYCLSDHQAVGEREDRGS